MGLGRARRYLAAQPWSNPSAGITGCHAFPFKFLQKNDRVIKKEKVYDEIQESQPLSYC